MTDEDFQHSNNKIGIVVNQNMTQLNLGDKILKGSHNLFALAIAINNKLKDCNQEARTQNNVANN